MDYFLHTADQKINYWESVYKRDNPYNPYNMIAEFNITEVDDAKMIKLKKDMKDHFDLVVDEMLVVEGCVNDDKTILGGR